MKYPLKCLILSLSLLTILDLKAQEIEGDSTDNNLEWIEISFLLNDYYEKFNHVWHTNGTHFKSLDCPKSVPNDSLLYKFQCVREIDSLKFLHRHLIEGYDTTALKPYLKEQLKNKFVLLIEYGAEEGFWISSYSIVKP